MDTIDDRVRTILAEELGLTSDEIASDRTLSDLGADSADRLSLTLALEGEFAIEIPDHDGQDLQTVRQVVDYITQRAGEATA